MTDIETIIDGPVPFRAQSLHAFEWWFAECFLLFGEPPTAEQQNEYWERITKRDSQQ